MIRKLINVIFLTNLFLISQVYADNSNESVQYNKNKPYCKKPLKLTYSPHNDKLFCSQNSRINNVFIDSAGKPYCRKPFILENKKRPSKIFKTTPFCVKANKR